MILVIGATGQLGTVVVRRLAASGQRVRAFVRPQSDAKHLNIPNVELAYGDLRDAASVGAACAGADVIIATANTVAPRGGYTFDGVEGEGYRNLIAAAEQHGARQFIFMSVPVTPHDDAVPTFRYKRLIEGRLMKSKVPYTIFRGSLFMDDWFALIGSSIPLRGAEVATLRRPFWFSRAFIALDDVADFLVKAVDRPAALNATFEIGGPEVLSWDEVVALFGRVLGKPVRALYAPAGVFRMQQMLLSPISPAAGNLMGMNWVVGTTDTAFEMSALAPAFGITLTTSEAFLRQKLALPA